MINFKEDKYESITCKWKPKGKRLYIHSFDKLAKTLQAEGVEAEIIHIGNKDIRGCIACRKCHSTGSGKCVFDDIVNEVAPKLAEADAFVIGSPVYFSSPAGSATGSGRLTDDAYIRT